MPQLDLYIFFDLIFLLYWIVLIFYLINIFFFLPFIFGQILLKNWLIYEFNNLLISYKLFKIRFNNSFLKNEIGIISKSYDLDLETLNK